MDALLQQLQPLGNDEDATCVDVIRVLFQFIDANENSDVFEHVTSSAWPANAIEESTKTIQSSLVSHEASDHPIDAYEGMLIATAIIEISKVIESETPNAQHCAVAFAFAAARALDHVYANQWIKQFRISRESDRFTVENGDVFPVALRFSEQVFRRRYGNVRLATAPERRSLSHRQLKHVALLKTNDFKIVVDTRLYGNVADVQSRQLHHLMEMTREDGEENATDRSASDAGTRPEWPQIATGLLNHWDEMHWEEVSINGNWVIQKVAPRKADDRFSAAELRAESNTGWEDIQYRRCVRLLELSIQEAIDVLVLPELCVTDAIQERLLKFIDEDSRRSNFPAIIVLGSAHVCRNDSGSLQQENRLLMIIRSENSKALVVEHRKFNPLTQFKSSRTVDADGNLVLLDEQLDNTVNQITVVTGEWCSITPLICKDFLHTDIQSLWPNLMPSLILVPALSATTGPFVDDVRSAAAHARAITVVADNGIRNDCIGCEGKKFATFGLIGENMRGAAGVAHEPVFQEQLPSLPSLLVLRWATDDGDPEVPHVQVVECE